MCDIVSGTLVSISSIGRRLWVVPAGQYFYDLDVLDFPISGSDCEVVLVIACKEHKSDDAILDKEHVDITIVTCCGVYNTIVVGRGYIDVI